MRKQSWAVAAIAVLLLSGCSGAQDDAQPEPKPEVLSATKAGGLYLSAVCPVNDAWDELDVEVDRLRIALGRGEDSTVAFEKAMRAVASASEQAAKQLEPKNQAWPKGASDEVEAVRDSLRADAKQAAKVAELPIDKAANYAWKDTAEAAAASASAREVLSLPGDAVAACTQWDEQQAEAAAKKAADKKAADKKAASKQADESKPSEVDTTSAGDGATKP